MLEVTLPSFNPFVLQDVGKPEVRRRTLNVKAGLFLPDPLPRDCPAVVVLQGLGGPKLAREYRYGKLLADHGYAALVVDSVGARGLEAHGDEGRALRMTETMILADAFAALRFLAAEPWVDTRRIGVLGFSYGAMVAIFAAYEQTCSTYGMDDVRFAAHVSYYGCTVARFADPTTTGAPVAMLIGELEHNASLPRTRLIAGDLRRGGSEVMLHEYPGAYHQWDGADREKRHVRFHLRGYDLIVGTDNVVRDRFTRMTVRGRLTRTLVLAANAGFGGYDILRDEQTRIRSDRDLLDFLRRTLARGKRSDAGAGSR